MTPAAGAVRRAEWLAVFVVCSEPVCAAEPWRAWRWLSPC